MTDEHLARLLFDGADDPAAETGDEVVDSVVYIHDTHHRLLNDDTAWGILLHALARTPGAPLRRFLDATRTTHETFATYSSISIAAAHYGDSPRLYQVYPACAPLFGRMREALTGVAGTNRKLSTTTALALVCMQSPVLELATTRGPAALHLADVRIDDLPDRRWARLLAGGPALPHRVAAAADAAVAPVFGTAALDADLAGGTLADTAAVEFEEHWRAWEVAAYAAARAELPGIAVLDYAGHRAAAGQLARVTGNTLDFRG
ncbi:hypothetical protein [Actinokineospora enzanensis]|uniref:hypothetical protein n=1 Tax=Actinokineospora enzanensis TaxID=155975 RepID=UPI00036EBFE0|nr:hypothetical protein [Actinokineospora enzanensis]